MTNQPFDMHRIAGLTETERGAEVRERAEEMYDALNAFNLALASLYALGATVQLEIDEDREGGIAKETGRPVRQVRADAVLMIVRRPR